MLQVVGVDCDTTSYDLQPTFSECLEYFEGDPCEDTRQSKKQKVGLHLAVLLALSMLFLWIVVCCCAVCSGMPVGITSV